LSLDQGGETLLFEEVKKAGVVDVLLVVSAAPVVDLSAQVAVEGVRDRTALSWRHFSEGFVYWPSSLFFPLRSGLVGVTGEIGFSTQPGSNEGC
jgi:hypothetical protein